MVLFGNPIIRDCGRSTKGLLLLALRLFQRQEVGAVCCLLLYRRAKIILARLTVNICLAVMLCYLRRTKPKHFQWWLWCGVLWNKYSYLLIPPLFNSIPSQIKSWRNENKSKHTKAVRNTDGREVDEKYQPHGESWRQDSWLVTGRAGRSWKGLSLWVGWVRKP